MTDEKAILVRMPEKLHTRIKVKAAKEKTSLQSLLMEFLKNYVDDSRRG